jgi:hypothetical protein
MAKPKLVEQEFEAGVGMGDETVSLSVGSTEDNTAVIREAFTASVSASKEEDDVKMDMIAGGATFKNVARLYNQFMIDSGLAVSPTERKKLVEDTLEGLSFDTEEGFDGAVNTLMSAIQGSTDRSAAALVRSYAKRSDLEVFAKSKASAGAARPSFASSYYEFLKANPAMTIEEATAFINGEGDLEDTSENVKKHASHYLAIWNLVNQIATK